MSRTFLGKVQIYWCCHMQMTACRSGCVHVEDILCLIMYRTLTGKGQIYRRCHMRMLSTFYTNMPPYWITLPSTRKSPMRLIQPHRALSQG